MRLGIKHVTTYRYRRPVTLSPHRLLLFPRSSHDLNVLERALVCSPEPTLSWGADVFGNVVATASFEGPTTELVISSEMTVEQTSPTWPVFLIDPSAHAFPFDYSTSDREDLGSLAKPGHDDPEGKLRSFAEGFILSTPTDTLSLLKDINNGLLDSIFYRTREEEGTQSPLQTLTDASGSCRDIAALFIEIARTLGLGARAVSGYMFDPDAAVADPGSTHAWAEVFLPGAGWIAFDPTDRRVGSAGLIATAIARCNEQIMPVTGGYAGSAEDFETMEIEVSVREVTR